MTLLYFVESYVESPLPVPKLDLSTLEYYAWHSSDPDHAQVLAYLDRVLGRALPHCDYAGLFSVPSTPPSRSQKALTVLAHYAKIVAATSYLDETEVVVRLVDLLCFSIVHAPRMTLWNEIMFNMAVLTHFPKLARHLPALPSVHLSAWNHQVLVGLARTETMAAQYDGVNDQRRHLLCQKWLWVYQAYVRVNDMCCHRR